MIEIMLVSAIGLSVLNLYALALVVIRAAAYRRPLYAPMIWNTVLSIAPAVVLFITLALLSGVLPLARAGALLFVLVPGTVVWLLLLPNSAYLVTELNFSHRAPDDPVPLWFDIAMVLTLALSGIANTLANVAVAQVLFAVILGGDRGDILWASGSWIAAAAVVVLVPFGMYLGRYIRFNSWDLLRPAVFLRKISTHFSHRGNVAAAGGFVMIYSTLLAILYATTIAPVLGAFALAA